jgi:hypothetical protein
MPPKAGDLEHFKSVKSRPSRCKAERVTVVSRAGNCLDSHEEDFAMLSLIRTTVSAATIGISALALSPTVYAATPIVKPPAMAAAIPNSSIVAAAWHGGWGGGAGWGWRSGWGRPGWGRPGWGRVGWGRPGWGRSGWGRPGWGWGGGWGNVGWRGGWGWRRGWAGPGVGLGWGTGWGYAPAYYGGYGCPYGYGYGCGYPYAYGGAPTVSFSVGGWGW